MKPMSWWTLLMFQMAEPIQLLWLGGSSMAWIRFVGESNHKMAHSMLLIGIDPEGTLMGCKLSQAKEWYSVWGKDLYTGIGGRNRIS